MYNLSYDNLYKIYEDLQLSKSIARGSAFGSASLVGYYLILFYFLLDKFDCPLMNSSYLKIIFV